MTNLSRSLVAIVLSLGIVTPALAAPFDINWNLQDSGDSPTTASMSIPNSQYGYGSFYLLGVGTNGTDYVPHAVNPGDQIQWNGTNLEVSGVPTSHIVGLDAIIDSFNTAFGTTTSAISTIQTALMGLGGSGGGGGSIVQPDWGESSTTAADFVKNKPSIPAAQLQSNWNATTTLAAILNKPSLATVATSGSYTDLTNKPLIQSGPCTTDGSGNCTLTFGTAFSATPKVAVTAIQATTTTLTNAQVTSKNTTSVTIHVNTVATILGLLTLTTSVAGSVVDIIAMP